MKKYRLNILVSVIEFLLLMTLITAGMVSFAVLVSLRQPLRPVEFVIGADSTEMLTVPAISLRCYINADTALQADRQRSVSSELKYYLDRHNVQDEGYEMVAEYGTRDISMSGFSLPEFSYPWNGGHWHGLPRRGAGYMSDSLGRMVVGTYHADSLQYGVRIDSAGVYEGSFSIGLAHGHGIYLSADGSYYEGQWQRDRRHGFGFAVAPFSHVRVGQWQDGNYLGEHMQYTTERIYGIDISRYQHGKGRKKYGIDWNRMRIVHLGTRHQQRVRGVADYPVRFIFIKSTEGVKIRNPFYFNDYMQARRHGIPVGAYHFFSWKTGGLAQAKHFINHSFFRSGDLPPVLDLEPTAGQVAAMGGTAGMFRQVRAWLHAVEAYSGVRPILYVSQQFVNRYLSDAPDLKQNYPVWIARYGEFRPDLKLAVWQLSPEGRVSGIRGEVDINVFNGYEEQFEEFLEQSTIK